MQNYLNKIRQLDPRPVVLGRCSCVGKGVLEVTEKPRTYQFVNQQKARIDLFRCWYEQQIRPQPTTIKEFIPRNDVFGLIQEEQQLPWLKLTKSANYCLLDTFSELTDKKFTHKKDGWSFCCHYSDVLHVAEFERQFMCEGLLPDDDLAESYEWFCQWISQNHPLACMYVVLVPTTLDNRDLYKKRAILIEEVLKMLAKKYTFVKILKVNDSDVEHHPDDEFPYHFASSTYFAFRQKWNIIRDIELTSK